MSVAVCLNCGEFKVGAFTYCPHCKYEPHDDESLTKHLLATDHYCDQALLESIAERVKAGVPVTFDAESMKAAWVSKKDLDASSKKARLGCWLGVAVLAALVASLIYAMR